MADTIEPRVTVLEQIAQDTRTGLSRLEQRLDQLVVRFDQRLDQLVMEVRAELREMRADLRSDRDRAQQRFYMLLVIFLAGYGTLLLVMAHGFHWL